MRQAFVHAFLPSAEREALVKTIDEQVYNFLLTDFSAKNGK